MKLPKVLDDEMVGCHEDGEDDEHDEPNPPGPLLPSFLWFVAAVFGHERGDDERDDAHELDENVERGARCVLERIADGIAHDHRLVFICLLRVVVVGVQHALAHVFLGVIPRATSVGHHHSQQKPGGNSPCKQAEKHLRSDHETNDDGAEDSEHSRDHHFLDGLGGANVHAFLAVEFRAAEVLVVELRTALVHDRLRSGADGKHGESREDEGEGGAEDDAGEDNLIEKVDRIKIHSISEGIQQRESSEDSRTNGETLSGRGGGVAEGVQGVGCVTCGVIDLLRHLRDTPSVIRHGPKSISCQRHAKSRQHGDSTDSNAVDAGE
mmetsp:Transcript_17220/g.32716  ORF Transcript_17220/g.32716 Transcript_17220/m.32716 type:complete len:323 (+) Transcript_17220:647-1615(+)